MIPVAAASMPSMLPSRASFTHGGPATATPDFGDASLHMLRGAPATAPLHAAHFASSHGFAPGSAPATSYSPNPDFFSASSSASTASMMASSLAAAAAAAAGGVPPLSRRPSVTPRSSLAGSSRAAGAPSMPPPPPPPPPHPQSSPASGYAAAPWYEDDDDATSPRLSGGSGAARTSRRRPRATPAQLALLEDTFRLNVSPRGQLRTQLAQRLGMTERSVQVWFQNRRAKAKVSERRVVMPGGPASPHADGQHPPPSRMADSLTHAHHALNSSPSGSPYAAHAGLHTRHPTPTHPFLAKTASLPTPVQTFMLGLPQPAMAHARSPGTDITSATLTSASVGLSSASVGLSSHLSGPAQASPHYWPRSALSASGLHTSLPIAPPHANALAHSLSAFSLLPSPVHPTAPPASAGAVHAAHPGPAPGSVGLTAASGPPPSGATSLLSPVPSPAPALHALQAAAAAAAGVVRLPVSHVMLGTRWQRAAPQVRVHVDPLRHELAYTVVAPATGREDPGVSPSTLRLRVPLGDIVSWDVLPAAGPAGAVGSAAPSAAAAAAAAPVDGKSLLMELPGMPGAADGEPERFASLPMDTLLLRVKRRPACEIATGGGWTAVPDGLEQPEGTVLLHRLVGAGLAAAWCRARDLAGPAFHFLASPPAMPAAGAAGASASPMADPASGLGKVLPGGPAGLGGATSGGDVSAEAFMESLGFAEAFPTPPTTTDGGQGALAPPLSPPPPPGSPRVMSSLAAMPPMPPMPPSLLS